MNQNVDLKQDGTVTIWNGHNIVAIVTFENGRVTFTGAGVQEWAKVSA